MINILGPNAEWLYERIITLLLYPRMTDDDVNIVIKEMKKMMEKYDISVII